MNQSQSISKLCNAIECELKKSVNLKLTIRNNILKLLSEIVVLGCAPETSNESNNINLEMVRQVFKEEVALLKTELVLEKKINTPTYAEVVAPKPSLRGPSIVLSSKTAKSHQDIIKNWRDSTSFRNKSYAPVSTKKLSNNKLLIEFENNEQKTEILKNLESQNTIVTEEPIKLMPHIIIKGISRDIKKEDLINILTNQNSNINFLVNQDSKEVISLKFLKNNFNRNLYNAVLECTPKLFHSIVSKGKINVDHERLHVMEYIMVRQCFGCLRFGHIKKFCVDNVLNCSYCGGKHFHDSCPHKNKPEKLNCLNCTNNNHNFKTNFNTNHLAVSTQNCNMYKLMETRLKEKIVYGW